MAVSVSERRPVAPLPLLLGLWRQLEVATVRDQGLPPHPDHIVSCGRGVEARGLALLAGSQALYKGGQRLAERGMLPRLQAGLQRASLNAYRLGQLLATLFAPHLNQVFQALALKALHVYALPTLWRHQDTTTMTLYGSYDALPAPPVAAAAPVAPRPTPGYNQDGHPELKQGWLRLGVRGDSGLPPSVSGSAMAIPALGQRRLWPERHVSRWGCKG